MGLDNRLIPPHLARLIDPQDRAGAGIITNQEAGAKPRRRSELAEQRLFAAWLKLQRSKGFLRYYWHGTHKKTTATLGTPDFIIALPDGKSLWLEFKVGGNKPSPEQASELDGLRKLQHTAGVVSSAAAAIQATQSMLYTQGMLFS